MQVRNFVFSRKLSGFCKDIRIITINVRIRSGQWGPGSEQESEPVGRRDGCCFCFGAYLTRVLALWATVTRTPQAYSSPLPIHSSPFDATNLYLFPLGI